MSDFELKRVLEQKLNLKLFMQGFMPILQSDFDELQKQIETIAQSNPYLDVKSSFERSFSHRKSPKSTKDVIEANAFVSESLYEKLLSQITQPLFPTPLSQKIAKEIVEHINEEGYFEGEVDEIAKKYKLDSEIVERIRCRFSHLEPSGVGAKNLLESFIFQLQEFDVDDELYVLISEIIDDFFNIDKFAEHKRFEEAKAIIKKFKNPPALDYIENSLEVIPELFVSFENGEINIRINDKFYPDVTIKNENSSEEFAKTKLKEAKNVLNMLTLRKATLYKIAFTIIEKQISFFFGGELLPLKLQDIADELELNESTISRAISNKYIATESGIVALKELFSTAISKNVSSSEIKSFLKSLIVYEDRLNPLTDEEIVSKISNRYLIALNRRNITKYRAELQIPSSIERKKLYLIGCSFGQ